MKQLVLGLFAAASFGALAQAADLDPIAPEIAAQNYQYFVTAKIGAGPSLIDNEFVTTTPTAAGPSVSTGEFDDEWIAGVGVEAGAFLSDNIRVSAQFNIGRIEHDREVLSSGATFAGLTAAGLSPALPLNGHTKVYQGFAKVAYEVPLADLGLTAPIFERSSVFAVGGVGFTHLRSKASLDLRIVNGLVGDVDAEDTVLSGLVGFGTAYAITDNLDLVSETNFVFGGDADLGFTLLNGAVRARTVAETQALTSQVGLRFKF